MQVLVFMTRNSARREGKKEREQEKGGGGGGREGVARPIFDFVTGSRSVQREC